MLARFLFCFAVRTRDVGVLIAPGVVGGTVAFCCSHRIHPPHHKPSQAYKGVLGEGGGVFVIEGVGRVGGPVLELYFLGKGRKGFVSYFHEFGGGDVYSLWDEGVE